MQQITKFTPGTFCWIELFTSNLDAAKEYYNKIFSLGFDEVPMPENQVYTIAQVENKPMGGMFPLTTEMKANSVTPHWSSYIAVSNASETTQKAKKLGATIIREPFNVMEAGVMSIIQDPTGAVFSLWQANDQDSPGIARNIEGSLSWNELYTTDLAKSKEFYCNLFGWTTKTTHIEEPQKIEYVEFKQGDISVGGMMQILDAEYQGEITPHWMVYIAVNDCDENAALSERLGAKVLFQPKTFPGVGRMAVIQDPQGAVYSTIKFEPNS